MSSTKCGIFFAFAALAGAASEATAQYSLTTLATFNGTNGSGAYSGLLADASGNLYGTTLDGGTSSKGTVYEIAAGTHTLSTLVTFNGTNGLYPQSGTLIADASGNLYGTTNGYPGTSNGTVFEIAAGTHVLTTLATFSGSNGSLPVGGLIADSSGNLYGITELGGSNNDGTVYEIAAGTHAISTLVNFNGTNGKNPWCTLVADSHGNMFGTTELGGANSNGTVFEIAAGTHAFSTIACNYSSGILPFGGLIIDANGNLYGTANGGGSADGYGTVFEIAAGTNTFTALATFNGANGSYPSGALLADSKGNLYATASGGGTSNDGTVFEIAAGTHAFSTLVNFNGTNGASPENTLIADANGNLYGTTTSGGANGDGTVFKLSPVPEPSSVALCLVGLLTASIFRRHRFPSS
jgi:uncharacterized repeat protein (TIGR03803 family)